MAKTDFQSNLSFRLMALEYRLRDRRQPPLKTLDEVGVKQGMAVLDFGCGPGEFSLAAAELVGSAGTVYALDIHPLAIKSVKRAVLHHLLDLHPILERCHRLLTPNGVLSVRDHRLKEEQLLVAETSSGHFQLLEQNRWVFQFKKVSTK